MKPTGTRNIIPFEKRTVVETSSSKRVRYLADIKGSPLKEFRGLLQHQKNFLKWMDKRHRIIIELIGKTSGKGKGPRGAKGATFAKYRWYAEQLVLLEAINAFETFYKMTFVQLGSILQEYVQPEEMKGINIEARLLWSITDKISIPALVFEQGLFHDLKAVDDATEMLIGRKHYNPNAQNNPLRDRVKTLRVIFQIRHTLSHNNGLVTNSDAAKFKRLGMEVVAEEVIDSATNAFGLAIFRKLEVEAKDFTDWLASATADYLNGCIQDRSLKIPKSIKAELVQVLGAHMCWGNVKWS